MDVKHLTPITTCEQCNAHIWADDVFKTFVVPKAPSHLALVFRCANCGHADRIAAVEDEWEAAKEAAEENKVNTSSIVKEAEIDLESIDSADDLIAEWASLRQPPLRESVMGKCGCEDCDKRLYG